MKKFSVLLLMILTAFVIVFSRCQQGEASNIEALPDSSPAAVTPDWYGGFESDVAWGKHLVTIGGCHDCHTPKKIGEDIAELDLSGTPSNEPIPAADLRKLGMNVLITGNL